MPASLENRVHSERTIVIETVVSLAFTLLPGATCVALASDFTSRASVSSLEAFKCWCLPTIAAEFAACVCAKSLQLCPTLCNPMHCNPQDSSIHGILQARLLEWVVMPSSRGIFLTQGLNPCLLYLLNWQAGSLPLALPTMLLQY